MLYSLFIVLASATIITTVFHFLKLPAIVAFMAAGILIGPSAFGWVESLPQVDLLTEASAILLMFTIGLEFSLKELAHLRRPLLYLGAGQVGLSIFVYLIVFSLFPNIDFSKALFLSFLMTLSSTAVVLKLLQDSREFETPYGRASTSILLAQDLAVIPMIIAVPFLRSLTTAQDALGLSFIFTAVPYLFSAGITILGLYLLGRYGIPFLFDRVSRTKNREIFFFTVLLICATCAALMHKIGLSISLGAFIAGMLISGSSYGKQAIAEILPLRNAFLSIFFVSIGMLLDVQFLISNLHKILFFGALLIFIKAAIIYGVVWLTGNSNTIARASTVLLFQFGEFSFILAELGMQHNLISSTDRQYFVAIAILSLVATPFLHARLGQIVGSKKLDKLIPYFLQKKLTIAKYHFTSRFFAPIELQAQEGIVRESHVIIIGYGVGGQNLSHTLKQINIPFSVIELNSETVNQYKNKIDIHYGDASHPEILRKVGVDKAKLVVVLTSGGKMVQNCLQTILTENPEVRILIRANYLRELESLPKNPRVEFIVGEIETTLEVVRFTLMQYEHQSAEADTIIAKMRESITRSHTLPAGN